MMLNTGVTTNAPAAEDSGEGDVSLIDGALDILRRRWRVLVAITIGLFLIAAVLIMMLTPQFVAIARVKIDPSPGAAMGQMSEQSSYPDQAIVDTEVSTMRSREIARAVVRQLRLTDDGELTMGLDPMPANASQPLRAERVDAVADRLVDHLEIAREKATYIVQVGYRSTNPQRAATIANAVASQYIASALDRRTGTAEGQIGVMEKRLRELGEQAAIADRKLAEYRAATGAVATDSGNSTVTDQQIAPLAGQLATAESEAAAARSRVAIAQTQIRSGGMDNVSAVLNSDVIRNLRSQRAQLVADRAEVQTRYGPRHPETQRASQQIGDIDAQINEEATRVMGGLQSDASSASARAASLRSEMAKLRGQQSSDTRLSAYAETYAREAESAHQAYDRQAEQVQKLTQVAGSSLSRAQIIENASPPDFPVKPKKRLLLAAALMLAFVTGLATIIAQELLSRTIRTASELKRLGLTVLGNVPQLDKTQLRKLGPDATPADQVIAKPMGSFAESYRVIRRSLPPVGNGGSMVAIVSTMPGEGKTTSALALARIMALAGERTLVIDTDLRHASIANAAGIQPQIGLVELLHGETTLDAVIVPDKVDQLDILPIATSHYAPEDLFAGDRMADLLAQLKGRYDRIILDSAPLTAVADARSVSTLADTVLLVVKWNGTPRKPLQTSLDWLRNDNANVAGAIFSMIDIHALDHSSHYYSKKYSAYYRED